MKVRCVSTDPKQFPVGDDDLSYYAGWAGRHNTRFDWVTVGNEYTVYAIVIYSGRPFYFVRLDNGQNDLRLVPALCFEVLDGRISSLWRYQFETSQAKKRVDATFAIEQWVEQDSFFERVLESKQPERRIMMDAVARMDVEFE